MQDPPNTRTSQRCVPCRLRKVKCTGGTAPCHNCHRLKLNCAFPGSPQVDVVGQALVSPTGQRTEAGFARRRISYACRACHLRKTKCDGRRPQCGRCGRLSLACHYSDEDGRRRAGQGGASASNDRPPLGTPSSTTNATYESIPNITSLETTENMSDDTPLDVHAERRFLSRDILSQHIEAYFTHIYHLPGFNFFHRPSMLEDLHNARLAPILSVAICSTVSGYLDRAKGGKQLAIQWATEVDGYISINMNNLSLLNLQVLMLSLYQHFAYRQFGRSWLLLGMATRLALGIQLNKGGQPGASVSSIATRECNTRLAWSIYVHDKLQSGGIEEFVAMPKRWMHISLPMSDDDFHRERDCSTSTLTENLGSPVRSDLSTGSYTIILMTLRYKILRATKSVIANSAPTQETNIPEILAPLIKLQEDMQQFYAKLPSHLALSDRNIFLHSQTSELISYISLHTWYFQACCDLFRICLPGVSRETAPSGFLKHAPSEFVVQWQRLAVSFALKLALTWKHLLDMRSTRALTFPGDVAPLDPANCISVYQCTKILLVARKHSLFQGLQDPVTCTPLHLDEEIVFQLGQSNLGFLRDLASIVPIAAVVQQDVQDMLEAENVLERDNGMPAAEQVPITSQVQREHVLSRYNVLAMGIAASNNDSDVPRPAVSYQNETPVSAANPGYTAQQRDSAAGDIVQTRNLVTYGQGFDHNRRSMSYPQQQTPLQYDFNHLSAPHTSHTSQQETGNWSDTAVSGLGTFMPTDILQDYTIAGSQFDMGGELDWFLMNSFDNNAR